MVWATVIVVVLAQFAITNVHVLQAVFATGAVPVLEEMLNR